MKKEDCFKKILNSLKINKVAMTSKDFMRAAEKHYKTCKFMLDNHENANHSEIRPHVISNIFYLSGYVLECIFKYAILQSRHAGKQDFSLEELDLMKLKSHNLKRLWVETIENTKINKKDFVWTALTNKWDSEIRYDTKNNEFKDTKAIKEHFEKTVVPIFNTLKDKY